MPDVPHETVPQKRIDIAEFRELGFLQEANRVFFHPLGLALEVVIDACPECLGHGKRAFDREKREGGLPPCPNCDGAGKIERLGGVWDYRDDPEGIAYALPLKIDPDKITSVEEEFRKHRDARAELFDGRTIQKPGQELELREEFLEQGGEG